jgi:geranylgeranyl transferase type-2 subunit beta
MQLAQDDYLLQLTSHLAEGLGQLPDEFRSRHAAFLCAAQRDDGGFAGREGGSDLYYTGFALRGLAVLGAPTPEVAQRAGCFLTDSLKRDAGIVDLFSLLYAAVLVQLAGGPDVFTASPPDWPRRVADMVETFRAADGGYGKVPGGAGSTYHTFLVGLCYQLLGEIWPRTDEVQRFIHSRRRDDGGFVELAPMRRGGTNPTAAAVGVLRLLAGIGNRESGIRLEGQADVVRFLGSMAISEGGLRANARAPVADLLSTFTGAWTLEQLGALECIDLDALHRYASRLELPGGGFRAGLWDSGTDVEYTFYGLGVLGIIHQRARSQWP